MHDLNRHRGAVDGLDGPAAAVSIDNFTFTPRTLTVKAGTTVTWTRNATDAEDAAQECYLRALRHFDSYRGPAMKPWLLTRLRNVCNAEFARRNSADAAAENGETETAERAPLWQDDAVSPEVALIRAHDDDTVRRLIQALPQPFRETIVLREVNDLSYQQIAEVAGVPVGTVMSRLARARAMLRSAWQAAEGTTP